jgi:hypothetical protein
MTSSATQKTSNYYKTSHQALKTGHAGKYVLLPNVKREGKGIK